MEGDVDPIRDLDIINEELRLKDIEFFEKISDDCEKKIKKNANDKKLKEESVILAKIKKVLVDEKKQLRYRLDPPAVPSGSSGTPTGTRPTSRS